MHRVHVPGTHYEVLFAKGVVYLEPIIPSFLQFVLKRLHVHIHILPRIVGPWNYQCKENVLFLHNLPGGGGDWVEWQTWANNCIRLPSDQTHLTHPCWQRLEDALDLPFFPYVKNRSASTLHHPMCALMTHKYRGSIVVLSISKSVEPNEEQKEMISGFLCKHWNCRW